MTATPSTPPQTPTRDRHRRRFGLTRVVEVLLASTCLAVTGVVAAFALSEPPSNAIEMPLPLASEESASAIEAAVARRVARARPVFPAKVSPDPSAAAGSPPDIDPTAASNDLSTSDRAVQPADMVDRLRRARGDRPFLLWDRGNQAGAVVPLDPPTTVEAQRLASGAPSTSAALAPVPDGAAPDPVKLVASEPPAGSSDGTMALSAPPGSTAARTGDAQAAATPAEPLTPPLQLPFTLSGNIDAEIASFVERRRFARQAGRSVQPAMAIEVALARTNDDESQLYARIAARYDSVDGRRSRVEVREAHWSREINGVELRFGNLQESWGILERENIVDIVNQRDIAEDIRGDAKLGQPGVRLSVPVGELVRADVYWLPFFRPRTFTDEDARFGLPFPVRGTDGKFTSASGRKHQDFAGRIQGRFGDLELAASHFYGTSRDPRLRIELDGLGRPVALRPEYDLMHQTALEARAILGPNILKAEAFRRTGPDFRALGDRSFIGAGIGVEREITRILDSDLSLTLFAEYYRDNRKNGQIAPAPLDDDFFVGGRLAFNDFADTTLELSTTVDRNTKATQITGKLRRRVLENVELAIEADVFLNTEDDPSLQNFDKDSRILGRARVYF